MRRLSVVMAFVVGFMAGTFAPTTGTVGASGRGSWTGPFELRWSAGVAGELAGLETAADRFYAVTLDDTALEVVAFNLDDGTLLWQRTVTDTAWPELEYWGSATDYGPLFTFGAEEGGHLTLLDADSGDTRWDDTLNWPAYDVYGQVNAHVAVVDITERNVEFVELNTGERIPSEDPFETWREIGDELARIDSGSLEVGWDPFDPEVATTTLEVPTLNVDSSEDGRLIVAVDEHEVVGIVDGEEAWRWTPDVPSMGEVDVFDGYLGVEDQSYGWVNYAQFGRIGDDGVEPFDVLPKEFMFKDMWFGDNGDALIGVFNQEAGFSTDGDLLTTIELTAEAPTRQAPEGLTGFADVGGFGHYVYAASDDRLDVYEGTGLEPVTSMPFSEDSDVTAIDDGIIVYDAEQSTLSVYA